MFCECCGKINTRTKLHKESGEVLCECCIKMHKLHPIIYIPPKGEVHYDKEGNIICHICGRSFKKLAGHIKSKHHIDNDTYRELFGLNRTQGLTGKNFIPNITVDITTVSKPTHFKKGHKKSSVTKREQAKKNRTKNTLADVSP